MLLFQWDFIAVPIMDKLEWIYKACPSHPATIGVENPYEVGNDVLVVVYINPHFHSNINSIITFKILKDNEFSLLKYAGLKLPIYNI